MTACVRECALPGVAGFVPEESVRYCTLTTSVCSVSTPLIFSMKTRLLLTPAASFTVYDACVKPIRISGEGVVCVCVWFFM